MALSPLAEVAGDQRLEAATGVAWRGGSKTIVRETSTCRIETSRQYPAS